MMDSYYLKTCGGPIDTSVASKHSDLEFIKSNPDLISCIFEDKLKTIDYVGGDTKEYIEKLNKLKHELEKLIVKWV